MLIILGQENTYAKHVGHASVINVHLVMILTFL